MYHIFQKIKTNRRNWLKRVGDDHHKARYKLCKPMLAADSNSLKKHKSPWHRLLQSEAAARRSISVIPEPVRSAWGILDFAFFFEHNIPFNIPDHLIDLLISIFSWLPCHSKCLLLSNKINGISKVAKYERNNLVEKIKNKFLHNYTRHHRHRHHQESWNSSKILRQRK